MATRVPSDVVKGRAEKVSAVRERRSSITREKEPRGPGHIGILKERGETREGSSMLQLKGGQLSPEAHETARIALHDSHVALSQEGTG